MRWRWKRGRGRGWGLARGLGAGASLCLWCVGVGVIAGTGSAAEPAAGADDASLDALLGLEEPDRPAGGQGAGQALPEVGLGGPRSGSGPGPGSGSGEPAEALESLTPAHAMERVLTEMSESADVLRQEGAELAALRLQQRVIQRLDQVIAAASQPPAGGGGGGSQGGQNQDNTQNQPQDGQPGGRPEPRGGDPAAASAARPQGGDGGDAASALPGELQAVETSSRALDELRTEWGALPPRLRDALSDGLEEPFSPVYREATEAYYRRLAEEAGRE